LIYAEEIWYTEEGIPIAVMRRLYDDEAACFGALFRASGKVLKLRVWISSSRFKRLFAVKVAGFILYDVDPQTRVKRDMNG
jgi:hypothetical protein